MKSPLTSSPFGVTTINLTIKDNATGFLLARCYKGTSEPDWKWAGDVEGRIYNKSPNINFEKGTTKYTAEKFEEYNDGTVYPEQPAEPDSGEEPTKNVVYLNPGPWETANAYYEAWTWGGSNKDSWVKFEKDGDYYKAEIYSDRTGMKILRKAPDHASQNWDCWNDTGDLSIPDGKNTYTITDWSTGYWQ